MNKKLPGALTVRPILDKKTFYLLSFTWGLPMTLAGLAMAISMLLTGHRMHHFGPCFYFERGKNWGGMTWGFVIVVCEGAGTGLLAHELGHAMQNCRFGPFMPFLVGIPSSLRYHARRIFTRINGKEPRTPYDAAWFEGQATAVGREYVKMTAV